MHASRRGPESDVRDQEQKVMERKYRRRNAISARFTSNEALALRIISLQLTQTYSSHVRLVEDSVYDRRTYFSFPPHHQQDHSCSCYHQGTRHRQEDEQQEQTIVASIPKKEESQVFDENYSERQQEVEEKQDKSSTTLKAKKTRKGTVNTKQWSLAPSVSPAA